LLARSQGQMCTREPSSAASFSSRSVWRPEMATLAPCLCSARAMLPPMPPVAPVMSAVLSVSSNMPVPYRLSPIAPTLLREGRHRWLDVLGRADRACVEGGHNALGKLSQHLPRANLIDVRNPVGGHPRHAFAPAHGPRHLLHEPLPDFRGIPDRCRQH